MFGVCGGGPGLVRVVIWYFLAWGLSGIGGFVGLVWFVVWVILVFV